MSSEEFDQDQSLEAAEQEAREDQETESQQEGQDLAEDDQEASSLADAESQEAEEVEAPKSLQEIQQEELAQLQAAASTSNLLFYSPNLDEIVEQAKAEREAKRQAEEQARRERRLADLDPEITSHRRRRRRRGDSDLEFEGGTEEGDPEDTIVKVRAPRLADSHGSNRVTGVRGSTRLEAKRLRRRETRATGRRRQVITEAEFLARRESVDRQMLVRQKEGRIQIGVLEDGILAEHFVSKTQQDSLIGNVYLGKVQNVLPSMEAAFVDIGRGRNAVLYAGEVNWDVSGLDGAPRKIENALKAGDSVLVQVTKDPIGHKGARLTSQVSLPGRYLVYVPGGSMTGISRKLPDVERARLKRILKDKLPEGAGVIVRTAAEGASEEELTNDINRLRVQWEEIEAKSQSRKVLAPELLYQEPDLTIKTVRDVFNEDFSSMLVQGQEAWDSIEAYVTYVAPDLLDRLTRWEQEEDLFDHYRIEEQLAKALDRKVYLPSGGSLVIDRTEAMTVVDVNTGKFTGSGGNLEETVTKNNLEAAEEIVRQLRLRDIGGIVVIDFIDMVLESNRELVLRRLVECLGRDRTKHQVAEVTSLGLVQMTRKRMGTGLLEVFSEPCEACAGRGILVHDQPLKGRSGGVGDFIHRSERDDRKRYRNLKQQERRAVEEQAEDELKSESRRVAMANIVAASASSEEQAEETGESKSARKRKRRKRNRRAEAEAAALAEQTSEQETSLESAQEESQDLTLESLEAVFDQQTSDRPARRSGRAGSRRASAGQTEEELNPELDSRFSQNSSRLEAIRAGEAKARDSQRAGRNFEPREGQEPSTGRGRAEQAERPKRRSRRADSSSLGEGTSRQGRYLAPQDPVAQPGLTGRANPGAKTAQAEPQEAETKSSAPVQTLVAPARPKRRSRRAVSTGLDGQVLTQQVEAGQGSSVRASAAQAPATQAEADAPVLLGIGVAAEDIKRPGR